MNFIVLQPNITKDFILSKINQESIMQHYTGLNVNSKKLSLSPLRNDKKVTCGFYKSKNGILYLHDFATGEHFDCWNVVMRLYNCSFYKALRIIAEDFHLIDSTEVHKKSPAIVDSIKQTESAKIQCQIKDFTNDELKWWSDFGIDKKLLKKYHIFSIKNVFLNGDIRFTSTNKFPIYGYYFGKDKNKEEKWKIYMPFSETCRFIGNLTQKILQGYKQLPKTDDLLIINKSMKDTVCLRGFGFSSISPNSETTFPSEKQMEEFQKRFKHILIIFDNDKAGLHNLWKVRKKYPQLNYYYLPKWLAKDFTDAVKKVGKEQMKEYINQFMLNYKFK